MGEKFLSGLYSIDPITNPIRSTYHTGLNDLGCIKESVQMNARAKFVERVVEEDWGASRSIMCSIVRVIKNKMSQRKTEFAPRIEV